MVSSNGINSTLTTGGGRCCWRYVFQATAIQTEHAMTKPIRMSVFMEQAQYSAFDRGKQWHPRELAPCCSYTHKAVKTEILRPAMKSAGSQDDNDFFCGTRGDQKDTGMASNRFACIGSVIIKLIHDSCAATAL